MSRCDLDLWSVDLESSFASSVTWSKSVRNLSEIEQSAAELLIILRIFAHVMSRCDLDRWPLDLELLQQFECHAFKLCTKFERNWVIYGWVIGDFVHLCRAIFGGGAFLPDCSQGCVDPTSPNLARHQAIISTQKFCFSVWISCCIFKRKRLKV